MGLVFFRTPKPKSFSYKPRYYDQKKAEWERKKAEHGLKTDLNPSENLRIEMEKRWRTKEKDGSQSGLSKSVLYAFYFFLIGGSIYVILFTDFVEKLVALFGVTAK